MASGVGIVLLPIYSLGESFLINTFR